MTKVKGHATETDVEQGRVRLEDRLGNIEANTPADLGRHQPEAVMGIKRALVLQQLHRFMIAVSQTAVYHDGRGGTAPDPLVLDQGSMWILLHFRALLVS